MCQTLIRWQGAKRWQGYRHPGSRLLDPVLFGVLLPEEGGGCQEGCKHCIVRRKFSERHEERIWVFRNRAISASESQERPVQRPFWRPPQDLAAAGLSSFLG